MDSIVVLVVSANQQEGADLADALRQDPWGLRLECESTRRTDALDRASRMQPHVLLLLSERLRQDSEFLASLGRVSPATRVLLRLRAPYPEAVMIAVRCGASGVLSPDEDVRRVARAVRRVSQGDVWFGRADLLAALRRRDPEPAPILASIPAVRSIPSVPSAPSDPAADDRLTPREEQILELIGAGLSNKEIGRRLEISDKTVKTHLHRVYVKLHQSGRYKALLMQAKDRAGSVPGDEGRARH